MLVQKWYEQLMVLGIEARRGRPAGCLAWLDAQRENTGRRERQEPHTENVYPRRATLTVGRLKTDNATFAD